MGLRGSEGCVANISMYCSRSTPLGLGVNLRLVQALFSNQIKVLKKLFYDYKRMNYVDRALGSDIQLDIL